jgi:hypothetical protein
MTAESTVFYTSALELARLLLETEHTEAFDYCAERGLILGNVKHMESFVQEFADSLGGGWCWERTADGGVIASGRLFNSEQQARDAMEAHSHE